MTQAHYLRNLRLYLHIWRIPGRGTQGVCLIKERMPQGNRFLRQISSILALLCLNVPFLQTDEETIQSSLLKMNRMECIGAAQLPMRAIALLPLTPSGVPGPFPHNTAVRT